MIEGADNLLHFKLNIEKKSSLLFPNRVNFGDLEEVVYFSTHDGEKTSYYT